MRFIDTNLLLYAISTDPAEQVKRSVAIDILDRSDIAFSVQVFQEFYHQATRRSRAGGLSHDLAVEIVMGLVRHPTQAMTRAVMHKNKKNTL